MALVAAAVATLLFGVPLVIVAQQLGILDERGETERFAANAAVSITVAQLTNVNAPLPGGEGSETVGLYGPDDVLVRGSGPTSGDDPVIRARQRRDLVSVEQPDTFVVAVPVADESGISGTLRVSSPIPLISDKVEVLLWGMLGLGVFSLASASVVAALQARRLARPLEEVAVTADRLGHGDFSPRARRACGVAEIDQVGDNLDRTAARLNTLLTRERAFSADASHQLRTPLTRIRLGLEQSLTESPEDARRRTALAIEQADAMEQVIHDLLNLARDLPSRGVVTDLARVLATVEARYRGVLSEHGRRLEVRPGPTAATGAARVAIEQILQVLLDNAVAHGAGTVTVATRMSRGIPVIDVADDGNGPLGVEDELFSRNPRTDGSTGRNGIGLAMARSLAEAESGRLVYGGHSAARGTVFTLFLPPAPAADERSGGENDQRDGA